MGLSPPIPIVKATTGGVLASKQEAGSSRVQSMSWKPFIFPKLA
jgi:hypothetical protein